jgi:hypothetical protein
MKNNIESNDFAKLLTQFSEKKADAEEDKGL